MKALIFTLALLATLALSACASAPATSGTPAASTGAPTAGPSEQEARVPGIISPQSQSGADLLKLPDTLRAGEPFEVSITTTGGGCERQGDTSVLLDPAGASVMVYDFTTATTPAIACTAIFKEFTHTATLQFAEPGQATIRIWGRQASGGSAPAGEPIVIERQITIGPAQ